MGVGDPCSHTAPLLPGRDTVPEQSFAIMSEGASSTSPKTQSLPRTTRSSGMEARPGPKDSGIGKEQNDKLPYFELLQSRASPCFNGLIPSIAAFFKATSSQQAPGMKFHCKQSLSSAIPPQGPSGARPCPPQGRGDGDAQEYRGDREWHPRTERRLSSRLSLQLTPPSVHFQQRGFCPCPPGLHGSSQNATTKQKSPREEPSVQGSLDTAQALGQSPAAGLSRRYRKNKESVLAITGFSNMANRAIFTGAYLFSEDAGMDSRVSFFSPGYLRIGLNWLYLKASPPAHFS